MRAWVLTTLANAPTSVKLYWRPLGGSAFTNVTLSRAPAAGGVQRFIYTTQVPAPGTDFEYYLVASLPDHRQYDTLPAGTVVGPEATMAYFPPSAANSAIPPTYQTVVILP